jgi:uncharacterized phiE125 gp8 family phage protein
MPVIYPATRSSAAIVASDPIRVSPPAALPLALAELRAQCRLTDDDGTDENALLMSYLRAATEYVEQYTGLALITQDFEQRFSSFPTELVLGRRPVQEVLSVTYLDATDIDVAIASTVYRVAGIGSDRSSAIVRLGYSQSWPTIYGDAEAVRVTYRAGFGDDHNSVPELIRHALMLLCAYWYEQRSTALIDPMIVEVPFGTHALLQEWRPFGVA